MIFRFLIFTCLVVSLGGCYTLPTKDDFSRMKYDLTDPVPSFINREEQHLTSGASFFGPKVLGLSDLTFNLIYFVTPDDIVAFEFGTNEGSTEYQTKEFYYSSTFSLGFSWKYFIDNSSYLRVGTKYREFRANESRVPEFGYYFKGHRGEGIIGIGNQWQWRHHSFGLEWVTFALPFGGKFSEEGLNDPLAIFDFNKKKNQFSNETSFGSTLFFGF